MSLRCAKPQPVCSDREPLLIACLDDKQQVCAAQPRSGCICSLDEFIDAGPALRVESQSDRLRLVTQHEAQELAELNGGELVQGHGAASRAASRPSVNGRDPPLRPPPTNL